MNPLKTFMAPSRRGFAFFGLSLFIFVGLVGGQTAWANIGESIGFTSRSSALGGATVAWGSEGARAWTNPASLAIEDDQRLHFNWTILGAQPNFTPINDIVVENPYVSDKTRSADVDLGYRPTLGQAISLEYNLAPNWGNLSLGVIGFLPLEQITYLDTGEPYVPEYVLYRARNQRPQVEVGLGWSPWRELQIGVGSHLGFALTGYASVFLQSDQERPSSMRISASMKPRIAPYFGFQYRPVASDEEGTSFGPRFTLGGVVRLPLDSGVSMNLNTGAQVFGSFAGVDIAFKALSSIYYDPLSAELGFSWRYSDRARILVQADWQDWRGYVAPTLDIQDPSAECQEGTDPAAECGLAISGSENATPKLAAILIPRIGHEWQASEQLALRVGYSHRPSIFADVPNGAGNLLDPARDIVTAGIGWTFAQFLHFEQPATVDLYLAYHLMRTQQITKTAGTEGDATSPDPKVGSPGYQAGGNVIGGGVTLSLGF
jgi:hypothetical protein